MPDVLSRAKLLKMAASLAPPGRDWAEFGVGKGGSARELIQLRNWLSYRPKIWLFDSFFGLPGDWERSPSETTAAGTWNRNGEPPLSLLGNPDVEIVKGLFSHTVGPWAAESGPLTGPLGLVHIDCDLYESTVDVLTLAG